MKFFVIYPDQASRKLNNFNYNNQHLDITPHPIQAPTSTPNLREILLKENIISTNNCYNIENLAYTKAHVSLWQHAVETQSPITVFNSNVITHNDFLQHQTHSLDHHKDYDLFIWGYNLNWNLCIEVIPCLPKVIYTFPGNSEKELSKANNDLIDISLYKNSEIKTIQILKCFSFAGLACYTISAKGAKYLLEQTLPIDQIKAPSYQDSPFGSNFYVFKQIHHRDNTSLDIEINRHIGEMKTYISIPMLAVIPTNDGKEY